MTGFAQNASDSGAMAIQTSGPASNSKATRSAQGRGRDCGQEFADDQASGPVGAKSKHKKAPQCAASDC
jgi:hypothetical protein